LFSKGAGGEGRGKGGEMTQTLYAHMNKRKTTTTKKVDDQMAA
jgi:hypothetical protein